jgi:multiple sugar transport system substrate-binding protein
MAGLTRRTSGATTTLRPTRARWAWLLILTTVTLLFAACGAAPPTAAPTAAPAAAGEQTGGQAASGEVVNLTFWGDWSGEGEKQIQTMVQAFNDSHPNIKVTYLVQEDMVTKYLTAATSGTAPDVLIWDRWRTALYAPKGVFEPIDSFMERDGVSKDDFYSEALRELSWDNNLYGLPLTVDARALFYNKTLLDEAGVAPPTTWDELAAAAEKLTKRDASGKLVQSGMSFQDVGLFNMWLQQAGGQMVAEDGNSTAFNSPEGLEVLNFWNQMVNERRVYDVGFESGLGQGQDPFVTGQVAMMYTGPWMLTTYKTYGQDLEFGVVPPPAGPNGDRGAVMGGFGLTMSASSQQKDAAWEFIRWWLAEPENALLWAETSLNIPGNLEALNDPFFQDDPYLKPIVDTLAFATIRPPFPGYSPMEGNALIPNLQLFMQGDMDAATALAKAQEQGDKELQDNNAVSE